MAKTNTYKKENGVYYTPADLAEFLVKPLLNQSSGHILDPAYGDGALLLAAERVVRSSHPNSKYELHGCDTKPVNGLLKHIPLAQLRKMDFFSFNVSNKYDLIFTNPPYVRHHLLNQKWIDRCKQEFPDLEVLTSLSDLWAYFMVKASLHLNTGGSMGAILPWAFIQADYAQPLRNWLSERFGEIRVLSLSNKFFSEAEERVVMIWLKGFGQRCHSIEFGSAKTFSENITYTTVQIESWLNQKIVHTDTNEIQNLLSTCKSAYGFDKFAKSADIKIGVVTGADDFFVVDKNRIDEYRFHSRNLVPIISSGKQFHKVLSQGSHDLKKLLVLKKKNFKRYRGYIQKGIAKGLQTGAHAKLRKPWYSVKVGVIADAFFPYRSSKFPFMLRNNLKIQSTNSVHRIYFKQCTELEIRWIYVSLLSSFGQLSIESNSKTYGRGMLKIEPGSLKNVLVVKRRDKAINKVYSKVVLLLRQNKRKEAIEAADAFLISNLGIPHEFLEATKVALQEFQEIRL